MPSIAPIANCSSFRLEQRNPPGDQADVNRPAKKAPAVAVGMAKGARNVDQGAHRSFRVGAAGVMLQMVQVRLPRSTHFADRTSSHWFPWLDQLGFDRPLRADRPPWSASRDAPATFGSRRRADRMRTAGLRHRDLTTQRPDHVSGLVPDTPLGLLARHVRQPFCQPGPQPANAAPISTTTMATSSSVSASPSTSPTPPTNPDGRPERYLSTCRVPPPRGY